MLIAFLIMLREGIEAALIVGIVAGYLRQSGQARLMPAVWAGVLLAATACLGLGLFIHQRTGEIPQKQQELVAAVIGLIAVVLLTSMVFWMKKAARSIKGQLHQSIDRALSRGRWQALALVGMAFLAVAREGLESVFFLIAAFEQDVGWGPPAGALMGVLAAAAIGWGIYRGGVRLDLARFFRWTGVFILIVAAGLLAGSLRALHEAGVWNHLQTLVADWSHTLPVHSPLGVVLAGLLGYSDTPRLGEVLLWAAYLLITVPWFLGLRPMRLGEWKPAHYR